VSHYAKILNGRVQQVIVAEAEFFATFVDTSPGQWLQTSRNTRANQHLGPDGEPDGGVPLRGNFAGPGSIYDAEHDVFYAPQPWASWSLDTTTWTWQAPVPEPTEPGPWRWDETTSSWQPAGPVLDLN
jgi:hypothetical protein